jgi:hypothetical protein
MPVGGWLDPEATQEHEEQARDARAAFASKLEERQGLMIPDEDPDLEPLGPAWPFVAQRKREAILQLPEPMMPSAPGLAREAELEAGQ